MIGVKELPSEIQLPPALQQAELSALPRRRVQTLDDVERTAILQALAECAATRKRPRTSRHPASTLYNKMKRYAIEL